MMGSGSISRQLKAGQHSMPLMLKKSIDMKGSVIISGVLLSLIVLVTSAVNKPAVPPVIIGYVGGYKGLVDVSKIAAKKLSHINYAFVNVKNNRAVLGREITDTVNFKNLNQLKQQNPKLKILISIGGWTWSGNFSDAVLSDTSRKEFAKSAVDVIRKYSLDGVDIDWEYPGRSGYEGNVYRPEDKQNYTLMFKALRDELDVLEQETKSKKLLTTAVGGFKEFLQTTEMDKVQQYLDYVNLMTYDFYSDKNAGHLTNLYPSKQVKSENSADATFKAFLAAGVPAKKLVMGIAFYGRSYQLATQAKVGLGDSVISGGLTRNFTVLQDSLINKNGFKNYTDKAAMASYLFNDSTKVFITYENEASVRSKCKYVLDHQMGGAMFWEYASDQKGILLDEITKVFKYNK
jgi:chitinase